MNKKEIAEIKKLFTPSHCAITRICGCYVDAEKNIKTKLKEAFLSLEEEEMFKYFKIFKSTLSGTIGKNLLNMEFPLSQESEGGTQEFLLKLRNSELKDEALIDEFYEKVMADYLYPENYYIILIHGAYDVPGRASDNLDMDDASDYVYEFILCSICPVKLDKPGLCYNVSHNTIENRVQDWVVGAPKTVFSSRPSQTATRISTICCISRKTQRWISRTFSTTSWAVRRRFPRNLRKKRFSLL